MYLERLQLALPQVRSRIERACERSGRSDPGAVVIVGVTKGHPIDALRAARAAGLDVIGENRAHEAAEKHEAAGKFGLSWHMVGHLQRNKVKTALEIFSLIHSVDSLRLARAIGAEAEKRGRLMSVLVQVNVSGEGSKHGIPASEGAEPIAEICETPGLRVEGLMTMAPLSADERVLRQVFRGTRELFDRCGDEVSGFEPRYLSMGMTNDFEIALEEGSNMVRLGTVLFGERRP